MVVSPGSDFYYFIPSQEIGSKMTYFVLSRTLNITQSISYLFIKLNLSASVFLISLLVCSLCMYVL